MFPTSTLLFLVSTALLAAAQEPAYQGQLLIQGTCFSFWALHLDVSSRACTAGSNSGKCWTTSNSNGAAVALAPCTGGS
jgi:hypothetical protein